MSMWRVAVLLGGVLLVVGAERAAAQVRVADSDAARGGTTQQARRLPPYSQLPGRTRAVSGSIAAVLGTQQLAGAALPLPLLRRWEYDSVFGPRGAAKTIAYGVVQYEAPDKGLFEVLEIYDYQPAEQGGMAQYVKRQTDALEKWICDGKSVFEFDYARRRLIETQLPPEMQGQAIVDGPLPFLFGAKAEKIKQRYWLQVITPVGAEGEYWLEAWPLRREDAANFKFVEVIIDAKDFLPKAIQIYGPQYQPGTNASRTAFQFDQREVNFIELKDLDALQLFHRAFHRPALPKGWQHEVRRYQ